MSNCSERELKHIPVPDIEELIKRAQEKLEKDLALGDKLNERLIDPNLRLNPRIRNPYIIYRWLEKLHGKVEIDAPEWLVEAINLTVDFALKERACIMPGHPADMDHGHLICPDEFEGQTTQQAMQHANVILFHTQEAIDPNNYGLDPTKRNILFVRNSKEIRILDIKQFPSSEHHGINSTALGFGIEVGGFSFEIIDGNVKVLI